MNQSINIYILCAVCIFILTDKTEHSTDVYKNMCLICKKEEREKKQTNTLNNSSAVFVTFVSVSNSNRPSNNQSHIFEHFIILKLILLTHTNTHSPLDI